MTNVKFYAYQESQPGNQEFVWAIWRRHFQFLARSPKGFVASAFERDPDNANLSHISFEFTGQTLLDDFESGVIFNSYIWEVLPLLTRAPTFRHSLIEEIPHRSMQQSESYSKFQQLMSDLSKVFRHSNK